MKTLDIRQYPIREIVAPLLRMLQVVWQAAPNDMRRLVALNFISGAGPVITLYLSKVMIDTIAAQLGRISLQSFPLDGIWFLAGVVLLYLFLNTLQDSSETLAGFVFSNLRDRLLGALRHRIFSKITTWSDISLFENPKLLDIKTSAEQSVTRVQLLVNVLGNLVTGVFVFIPVFLMSFAIAWWIPLLIFICSIPSIMVQIRYEGLAWSVEYAQVGTVRKMGLVEQMLGGEAYAKEVKLFNLGALLLKRWKGLFDSAFSEVKNVRQSGSSRILAWSLLSGIGTGAAFVFVLWNALRGVYSLGDLALFAGLILQVRRGLFIIVGNLSNVREISLNAQNIFRLLDFDVSVQSAQTDAHPTPGPNPAAPTDDTKPGVAIRNLSFSYPGNSSLALQDISLDISPGEVLVIVGENGAGKSTLTKVLCRLYEPPKQTIFWNGVDVTEIEIEKWRAQLSVVMQDYARFPTTLRENIGFGDLSQINDDERLFKSLNEVGLGDVYGDLSKGFETPMTKQLDEGRELSSGQWQRLALARSLMREDSAQLIVLDEPTSALDPNTEHDILQLFRRMSRNKIAIIVSHRLSLAKDADKVLVITDGRVTEMGHHQQLMAGRGLYYEMFSKQASSYVDSN